MASCSPPGRKEADAAVGAPDESGAKFCCQRGIPLALLGNWALPGPSKHYVPLLTIGPLSCSAPASGSAPVAPLRATASRLALAPSAQRRPGASSAMDHPTFAPMAHQTFQPHSTQGTVCVEGSMRLHGLPADPGQAPGGPEHPAAPPRHCQHSGAAPAAAPPPAAAAACAGSQTRPPPPRSRSLPAGCAASAARPSRPTPPTCA